jgi:hypothetical protein
MPPVSFGSGSSGSGGTPLSCPVCKTLHPYSAPPSSTEHGTSTTSNDSSTTAPVTQYSHNARVIYASFACPICLEVDHSSPMVNLPCGHGICQEDFRLLGGTTTNIQADREARRRQQQQVRRQQREAEDSEGNNDRDHFLEPALRAFHGYLDDVDDDVDDVDGISMAIMYAYTQRMQHALEEEMEQQERMLHRDAFSHRHHHERMMAAASQRNNFASYPPPTTGGLLSHHTSLDDVDDSYGEEDDEDYDDDDSDDMLSLTPEEQLEVYHDNNLCYYDPPPNLQRFPTVGLWMLIPNQDDDNDDEYRPTRNNPMVNLMFYTDHPHLQATLNEPVAFVEQYPPGTKIIPSGSKHGLYIYVPPQSEQQQQGSNNNTLWNVYYVKSQTPQHRRRRRGGGRPNNNNRNYNNQHKNTTNPILKYQIPKNSSFVSDGHGGLWALVPLTNNAAQEAPESTTEQQQQAQTFSTSPATSAGSLPRNRNSNNNNNLAAAANKRRQRQVQLIHYQSRTPRGRVMLAGTAEVPLPATSKIFMDAQLGGVFLFSPHLDKNADSDAINNNGRVDRRSSSSFSSLWHVSHKQEQRLLLYRGIPRHQSRVIGDASGSSVFILSAGGRLQSILTRVKVEKKDTSASAAAATTSAAEAANNSSYKSTTCFSYDLDIPMDAIKDIVEYANNPKQVFLHCKRPGNSSSGNSSWRVCLVSPALSHNNNCVIQPVVTPCPRYCRILSDRNNGFWIWKKPAENINAGDRSFVHVHYLDDNDNNDHDHDHDHTGEEEECPVQVWESPRIFPPNTWLAGL